MMRIGFTVLMALVMLQACSPKQEETQAPAAAPQSAVSSAQPVKQNSAAAPAAKQASSATTSSSVAATPAVNEPVLVEASFTCKDGSKFQARFKKNKVDIVFDKYPPITLFQRVMASGFNYQNPQYQLQGKGKTASWTAGRRVPVECVSK